eukprot:scaffold22773_cov35-Cyclotella_meneghiniana.AAC.7
MIRLHTTEQLVNDCYQPIQTVSEVCQFVATMPILSRFRLPTEMTYQEYLPLIEEQHKINVLVLGVGSYAEL